MVSREEARDLVLDVLADSDLDVDQVGDGRFMTVLSGQWKRTIPVLLHLDERSLHTTTLVAGVPDEGHEEVYALLLHRNERPSPVRFALDDDGEIVLVGSVPYEVLDEHTLDALLGAILLACDEVFNRVLRAGFGGYIDAEQRWRERRGLPPNPVSEAP